MSNYPLAKKLHTKGLIKFHESTLFFNMDSILDTETLPPLEPTGECQPTHDFMWFEYNKVDKVSMDFGVLLSKWRDRAYIVDSVVLFPEFVPDYNPPVLTNYFDPDDEIVNARIDAIREFGRNIWDNLREISEIARERGGIMGHCAGVVFTSQGLLDTSEKALTINEEMFDSGVLDPSYSLLPAQHNAQADQTLSDVLNILNMDHNGVIRLTPDTYDKALGEE